MVENHLATSVDAQHENWNKFKTAFIGHLEYTAEGLAYLATNPSLVMQQSTQLIIDIAEAWVIPAKRMALQIAVGEKIYKGCEQLVTDIQTMSSPEIAGVLAANAVEMIAFDGLLKAAATTARTVKAIPTIAPLSSAGYGAAMEIGETFMQASTKLETAIGNARIKMLGEAPEVVAADLGVKMHVGMLAMEAEQVIGGGIRSEIFKLTEAVGWNLSETGSVINGRYYTKHALERMALILQPFFIHDELEIH